MQLLQFRGLLSKLISLFTYHFGLMAQLLGFLTYQLSHFANRVGFLLNSGHGALQFLNLLIIVFPFSFYHNQLLIHSFFPVKVALFIRCNIFFAFDSALCQSLLQLLLLSERGLHGINELLQTFYRSASGNLNRDFGFYVIPLSIAFFNQTCIFSSKSFNIILEDRPFLSKLLHKSLLLRTIV